MTDKGSQFALKDFLDSNRIPVYFEFMFWLLPYLAGIGEGSHAWLSYLPMYLDRSSD